MAEIILECGCKMQTYKAEMDGFQLIYCQGHNSSSLLSDTRLPVGVEVIIPEFYEGDEQEPGWDEEDTEDAIDSWQLYEDAGYWHWQVWDDVNQRWWVSDGFEDHGKASSARDAMMSDYYQSSSPVGSKPAAYN